MEVYDELCDEREEQYSPNINDFEGIVKNRALAHYGKMLNFPHCFQ